VCPAAKYNHSNPTGYADYVTLDVTFCDVHAPRAERTEKERLAIQYREARLIITGVLNWGVISGMPLACLLKKTFIYRQCTELQSAGVVYASAFSLLPGALAASHFIPSKGFRYAN
jgi:hypothetical protein